MSKNRNQGTAWQRGLVTLFRVAGFATKVLPELGSNDEGDVETWIGGKRVVIECRARENMSIHTALTKAKNKAPDDIVALAWKRLVKSPGRVRRIAAGKPTITFTVEDFLRLVMPDDEEAEAA